MDDKLTGLEGQAASKARRNRIVAGAVAAVAVLAGAALFIYRRTHRPTLRQRLSELSLDDLRAILRRWKESAPSVTVRVNEKPSEEPGTVEAILREVAPALVGTAGSALLHRLITTAGERPE